MGAQLTAEEAMRENVREDLEEESALQELWTEHGFTTDEEIGYDRFLEFVQGPDVLAHFALRRFRLVHTRFFFEMLISAGPSCSGRLDCRTFVTGVMLLRGGASSLDLHLLSFELKTMQRSQQRL